MATASPAHGPKPLSPEALANYWQDVQFWAETLECSTLEIFLRPCPLVTFNSQLDYKCLFSHSG